MDLSPLFHFFIFFIFLIGNRNASEVIFPVGKKLSEGPVVCLQLYNNDYYILYE